jgi:ABC-2 type transport system ATP-binding protein
MVEPGCQEMNMEICITGLSKVYKGRVVALQDIDLTIGTGMYGLLGPNGAGKTTLLRILATLLRPTTGRATVGGYDVADGREKWQVRAMLGYLPQELALYGDLSALEFLDFVGGLKRLGGPAERQRQAWRVLEWVGLQQDARRRLKTFSGGMKRRVGIAQALLGDPAVLIVDEPTAGLDPQERVRLRSFLAGLARERLILLSTHIVEDVAQTCARLAVLNRGRLLFAGTDRELVARGQGVAWEVQAPDYAPRPDDIVVAMLRDGASTRHRVLAATRPHPEARALSPSLEDSYLWLLSSHARLLPA